MNSDADLFADILEYREALAALKEFGQGFEVKVARVWTYTDAPVYVARIGAWTPSSLSNAATKQWTADGSGRHLLEAVRRAVSAAHKEQAERAAMDDLRVRIQNLSGGPTPAGAASEEPGKAP